MADEVKVAVERAGYGGVLSRKQQRRTHAAKRFSGVPDGPLLKGHDQRCQCAIAFRGKEIAERIVPTMHKCHGRCLKSAVTPVRSHGSVLLFTIILHGNMHLDSRNMVVQSLLFFGQKERGTNEEQKGKRQGEDVATARD